MSEEVEYGNGDSSPHYEDGGEAESVRVPEYDPFSLRQNVMSYTNPLRAKIILLVMLRPNFNFGSQSVAQMREHQLDDLLLEVLKTYPTMAQLEESMTYAVEQLVELEEIWQGRKWIATIPDPSIYSEIALIDNSSC